MTPTPRIRIYDLNNRLLGQVRCAANRSYLLNEAGRCQLQIAVNQLPSRDDVGVFFKPFNRVLIENEGHADWVGYLDGGAQWSGDGTVIFNAESAEGLLRYVDPRNIGTGDLWSGGISLGGGFFGLSGSDREWITYNEIGLFQDWEGDFGTESLYDALTEYFDDRSADWGMTHVLNTDGSLQLVLNFWKRRGAWKDIMLEESRNIELHGDPVLITEGPVFNSVRVYGDGATWDTRPVSVQTHNGAKELFGLREKVLKEEYTTQKKINRIARDFIRGHAAPRMRLALTVTDPALFGEIDLGDKIWVTLHSFGFGPDYTIGFRHRLRVIGKEHNEQAGTMPLIVENDLEEWYRVNIEDD